MQRAEAVIDQTLEAEFALRRRHPERDTIYSRHRMLGAAFRERGECRLDMRYGAGERCLLDVFPAGETAPVLFFVHGGYWRALDKSTVSFIAASYQAAGITVVMPGYDLVPVVRVGEIVDQIRAAYHWTLEAFSPQQVVVAGHSAGGQLAAMLALDQAFAGGGPIVGFAGISGAYDLRPLLRTSINQDLTLTPEEAAEVSPLLRLKTLPDGAPLVPLLVSVGGRETEGFKAWSTDLASAWAAHGAAAEVLERSGCTHFTILDAIADPVDPLHQAIQALFAKSDIAGDTVLPPTPDGGDFPTRPEGAAG